jgi:diguanylate cyclase (GGDEF)-like protein/PAS domain S-box-containing protein
MYDRLSLRGRVLLVTGAVLLLLLVAATWQTVSQAGRDIRAGLEREARRELVVLGQAVSELALLQDFTAIEQMLRRRVAQDDIDMLRYVHEGATLNAQHESAAARRPEWFSRLLALDTPVVSHDIVLGGEAYGQLSLRLNPRLEEDRLWRLFTMLAAIWGAGLAIMGVLMTRLLGANLAGLNALRDAARRMDGGDWHARAGVPDHAPPELRETGNAFDHMGDRLGASLTALSEQQRATDNAALVSETDLSGTITYVNDKFCQGSGYRREELIGQNHRIVKSDRHPPEFFAEMWRAIAKGQVWSAEVCNRAKDGGLYWVHTTITPMLGEDGLPRKYLSIRFDVTRRKQAEEELAREKERWQVTLKSIGDGVIVTDRDGRVVFMNAMASELTGRRQEEALRRGVNEVFALVSEETRAPLRNPALTCMEDGMPVSLAGQSMLVRSDGVELAVQESASPIHDGANEVMGSVLVFRNDTERRAMLREMRWLAYHDPLTGLTNRRAMEGRLERALHLARDNARKHAFCYIDLDQFKLVNDTCGHAAGDTLLNALVGLMANCVPERQHLARLGGDEFGLLLFDTDAATAKLVAERVIEAINDYRFNHEGRSFNVGASVGIAEIDALTPDIADIMSRADKACYAAKSGGRNRAQIYCTSHAGLRQIEDEMDTMSHLARALEENRFSLHRQRIMSLTGDGEQHYEILLRLRDEEGNLLSPARFLPAAERFGLAPRLDRWVVRELFEYLSRRPADTTRYSINLSGQSLADDTFLEYVVELLDQLRINAGLIGFEITESAAVADLAAARRFIHGLKLRGCTFYLDDFGAGMSSFAYLKHLPVDYIKIDGAFVRDLETEPLDRVIVNAIVQIGRDLKRKTIAEFVENEAVLRHIREIGVDYAQGYGIHRPEPLPE